MKKNKKSKWQKLTLSEKIGVIIIKASLIITIILFYSFILGDMFYKLLK